MDEMNENIKQLYAYTIPDFRQDKDKCKPMGPPEKQRFLSVGFWRPADPSDGSNDEERRKFTPYVSLIQLNLVDDKYKMFRAEYGGEKRYQIGYDGYTILWSWIMGSLNLD